MALATGEMRFWGAAAAPANWLLCNGGGPYNGAVYPLLWALIGGAYNIGGEPVGWFRPPDFRNRAIPTWAGGGWPTNDTLAEGARVPGSHLMIGGQTGNTDPWAGGMPNNIGGAHGFGTTCVAGVLAGAAVPVANCIHQHSLLPPGINDHGGATHYHVQNNSAANANWPPRIGMNVIIYTGL